jgi:Ni/Co efflux regulator RcnB
MHRENPLTPKEIAMKIHWLAALSATAIFAFAAQDRGRQDRARFDDNARQATQNWYNQNKDHPPAGLRSQDRLSADQESRLHEGAVLDRDLRKKVHPAPRDLYQRLPPPPTGDRYVTLGGHVGWIDNRYQVHDVIHLHDNR